MKRPALLLICTTALLAGCSIPSGRDDAPREVRGQPAPVAQTEAGAQCLSELGAAGAKFTPLPDRYIEEGCTALGTVQLQALRGDGSNFAVTNLGPVTCPVSAAFAAWVRFGVDRAARQILGSPLASVQTMGSYACRNVAGSGRRSAHASAAAIDIGSFLLEDGKRISVKEDWHGSEAERRFLRTVQQSACRRFATVLGPDYNAAHHDHLHVEGVVGRTSSYCR